MKRLRLMILLAATAALSACGGGGGGPQLSSPGSSSSSSSSSGSSSSSSSSGGSNVMAISVDSGPTGDYANGVFATVTVCVPGSITSCKDISKVLVDTGSYGLRLLASAVGSSPILPAQSNGSALIGECAFFADGFTWGPMVTADVQLGGLTAHNVPINLLGGGQSSSFPTEAPSACTSSGGEEDTLADLKANGILGIGLFQYDCPDCSTDPSNGQYFSCSSNSNASCTSVVEPLSMQVQNPVALFDSDNNGVLVQLPAVSSTGQVSTSGSVIFGIGTRGNNSLGSVQIVTARASGPTAGDFSTRFGSLTYPNSFIDSGSNGYFFDTAGNTTTISTCGGNSDFYCPSGTLSLSAVMASTITVPFAVANANTLFNSNNGKNAVFNDLAGDPDTGGNLSGSFDWGLPFFFNRSVFVAISGHTTPSGTGPYYAFSGDGS